MASKKNGHLITIEVQSKLIEIIDEMVKVGIYGKTRAEVVERGFCEYVSSKFSIAPKLDRMMGS